MKRVKWLLVAAIFGLVSVVGPAASADDLVPGLPTPELKPVAICLKAYKNGEKPPICIVIPLNAGG